MINTVYSSFLCTTCIIDVVLRGCVCAVPLRVHVCPPVLKAALGYLWAGGQARQGEDDVHRTE